MWFTPDVPGGRVSLPDHGWIEERPAGMEAAGGAWLGLGWASSMQAFPPLGSHPMEVCGQDNRKLPGRNTVLGSRNLLVMTSPVGMGRGSSSVVPQVSGARGHGRGMQPAGGNRRSPQRVKE